jgi:transposase, IS6 family
LTRSRQHPFKGRQFTAEIILWAVRWSLQFPISYRDLEPMLADRGVSVGRPHHPGPLDPGRRTRARPAPPAAPAPDHRLLAGRRDLPPGERPLAVSVPGGRQPRLVPGLNPGIDFLLSAKRDAAAARRFFRKALHQPHTVNPRRITVDKNAAYPCATTRMKKAGELWRFSKLRQAKYLNNIVEQDHRRIKRLVGPGLGFASFRTARRTLAGYEIMAMVRKGQVSAIPANDMPAQSAFVAALYGAAA